jgi:FkbM family methyltransferase
MGFTNLPVVSETTRAYHLVRWVMSHPLTRSRKAATLSGIVGWRLGRNILPGPIAIPFVNATRLFVANETWEAAYNMHFGLAEFEHMGLVLHALRPDDLFVDVGANIGSYTILASGAVGARSVAFEPVPVTFYWLTENIRLNNIASRVAAKNVAVGAATGVVEVSTGIDCMNHVMADGESSDGQQAVPLVSLDGVLADDMVSLIKIDVEGFEGEVLKGAAATLQSPTLLAAIVEINGSGSRYGVGNLDLHGHMVRQGFRCVGYDPLERKVTPRDTEPEGRGNAIYVRDIERLRRRVETAPQYRVRDVLL